MLVCFAGFCLIVGEGVGVGRDHTLYALTEGYVHFTWNPFNKKQVRSLEEALTVDDFHHGAADAHNSYYRSSQRSKAYLGLNRSFC